MTTQLSDPWEACECSSPNYKWRIITWHNKADHDALGCKLSGCNCLQYREMDSDQISDLEHQAGCATP